MNTTLAFAWVNEDGSFFTEQGLWGYIGIVVTLMAVAGLIGLFTNT
jgi:hypothetical protein